MTCRKQVQHGPMTSSTPHRVSGSGHWSGEGLASNHAPSLTEKDQCWLELAALPERNDSRLCHRYN
jgi:hypothetical protein